MYWQITDTDADIDIIQFTINYYIYSDGFAVLFPKLFHLCS